jgi:hypothetical protein
VVRWLTRSPLHPERPPFGTESLADEEVQFGGSLPLDKDVDWFTCIHGHRQFVVRRGTEQAARLGGLGQRSTHDARGADVR